VAQEGKTEKATPRRRKKEREEGKVIKSKELSVFFSFLAFSLLLIVFGDKLVTEMINILVLTFQYINDGVEPLDFMIIMYKKVLVVFLVIAFGTCIFMILNYVITVGFLFSTKAFMPDFKRMNPANYFINIFSRKKFVDIAKSLLIIVILGAILFTAFKGEIDTIASSVFLPWQESLLLLWEVFKSIVIKSLIALGVIGIIDYFYERYEMEDQMKMSKHDIREEYKDMDGNPQVKARRRKAMMEILKNEIIQKTPKSTVIITNPTHYSVALYYKRGDGAPRVMVKGVDGMALFIRKIAKLHDIPTHEDPPLARELYSRVMENDEIPEDMYLVVVAVLRQLMSEKQIKVD
jgi:flagellar biosynthesis protein FlhB